MSPANGEVEKIEEGLTPSGGSDSLGLELTETQPEGTQHPLERSLDPRDLGLSGIQVEGGGILGETEYQGYQEYRSMYGGVPFDLGSPGLAADVLYPSSSPVGATNEEEISFEDLFRGDFEIENERLFLSLNEFLSRSKPANPPLTTYQSGHDNQGAGNPLGMPPVLTQAESHETQGKQNTAHTLGMTSTPTEAKSQETRGKRSFEGLLEMPPTPALVKLEETRVGLTRTSDDADLNTPPPADSETEITHHESAPQIRVHSKDEKLARESPIASSSCSSSPDPGVTACKKYATSPEPPVKRPQTDTTGVTLYYHSMEEAEQAMNEHLDWDATNDDTVPQTNQEKSALVMELFLAMTDTSLIPEVEEGSKKPQAIRSFEEGKYLDWQIQMVCWRVLEQCILRQRLGPLVPLWQRTRRPKDFDNFKRRFEATCEALRCEKQLCKRLMASYLIDDFVDDPTSYVKRIQQNKSLNDKKKDQIKLGRAAQAATTPGVLRKGASRKRKVADMPKEDGRQAQPAKKRTRRTKSEIEWQDGLSLAESFQVAGSSQSLLPPMPGQDCPFPLDPALPQDAHNEEWMNWLNYGSAFLNDGTSYPPPPSMFDPTHIGSGGVFPPHPFPNSVANYQPTVSGSVLPDTNEQAPINHYGEALEPLSHLSHRAPRHQGSFTVSQPAEEEDRQTKPARKRRRIAKG